ncbi:MAG: hypothetical protein ACO3UU_06505 [Minisyncoccia bacterium]
MSTTAPVPTPEDDCELYINGIFEYDSGSSKITIGGLDEVYPTPGFVIATLTTLPSLIVAVPINSIFGVPIFDVTTPTFTTVCIPDL